MHNTNSKLHATASRIYKT